MLIFFFKRNLFKISQLIVKNIPFQYWSQIYKALILGLICCQHLLESLKVPKMPMILADLKRKDGQKL